MPEGRHIPHHDEAIVLRSWPFHEADLLVSLFTRQRGKVKGVARHAMKSRRRFGGALEPATQVFAHYTERPRSPIEADLVRLDSFEIAWSPLSAPVDALRAAGLQLVVEILDEAMPDLAPDDNIFRLAVTVLRGMDSTAQPERVHIAITYFCLWMARLMGWWPELAACAACGLDLRGHDVWWSPVADGVTCADDRTPQSRMLTAAGAAESYRIARASLEQVTAEVEQGRELFHDLGTLAVAVLERHLERRLRSAAALG